MAGRGEGESSTRAIVYCVVPRDLASKLHEVLRRHYAHDPHVEVVVERRSADRRASGDRRASAQPADAHEKRKVRNAHGRRIADRRAAAVAGDAVPLPRRARPHAARIAFIERLEPSDQQLEDIDTARVITRIQAGESDEFAVLYMRYFDRVYSYLRLLVRDPAEAEDLTQQVFIKVLQTLPRYEHRRSFWVWLVVVLKNHAINAVRKRDRIELTAPTDLDRRLERSASSQPGELSALDWITDRDLMMFIERLPIAQRQVLFLRFIADLGTKEIGELLERSPADVRVLQARALTFLRTRLTALGRDVSRERPVPGRRLVVRAHVLRSRRVALLG